MTRTIEDMDLVAHACLIPDSDEHLWEITAAWLAGGLAAGERVLYFEDDTAERVLGRLAEDRVAVDGAMAEGQLVIVPTELTRTVLGGPVEQLEQLIVDQIDVTAAQGWPGLRLSGESGPGIRSTGGLRHVVEYEKALDRLMHENPTTRLLCRYERRLFNEEAVAAMRDVHDAELVSPAAYDDTLLRITSTGASTVRLAGEVDHSNRPQIRRVLDIALDRALRSHSAPTDITLDLHSLRFVDVAGAVGLVHAAEEFPSTHRLVLTGVRPRVVRVLDRCGAPFAAQLVVEPRQYEPGADE